jgi:hypothetical protein
MSLKNKPKTVALLECSLSKLFLFFSVKSETFVYYTVGPGPANAAKHVQDSVADLDPGPSAFQTPGSGMEKNPDTGLKSRIYFRGHCNNFFRIKILELFVNPVLRFRIPGEKSRSRIRNGKIQIRNPEWKKPDPD